ncbi:MAG: hypothetical protein VX475_19370 [Myxococcota bacterium]|nr:hypothetical protein [Myxococcota bacterium]
MLDLPIPTLFVLLTMSLSLTSCARAQAQAQGAGNTSAPRDVAADSDDENQRSRPTAAPRPTKHRSEAPKVRVLYLVSSDKEVDPRRKAVIEGAITHVQGWYRAKLGGSTFTLNSPVVEVARSEKPARWFDSNPNGANRDEWSYNNILAQASKVKGVRLGDPLTVWVIYSDSPGGGGRGGNGVAILPDHDLLGLLGEHPHEKNVDRWVGGLAHEVGHTFGLKHTEGKEHRESALMQLGYAKYPETYLTPQEKNVLWRNPFFSVTSANRSRSLGVYAYAGGVFERRRMASQTYWVERKADGLTHFTFREIEQTETHSIARDDWRGYLIKIPLAGGESQLSADGGESWGALYQVSCEGC